MNTHTHKPSRANAAPKANIEEPRYGYGAQPFKPVTSAVLECACGAKYIKTRARQSVCLRCLFGGISRSRSRSA